MAVGLYAGIPVNDYPAALAWYEKLFGSSPTFFPHDTEAVWDLDEHRLTRIDDNLTTARTNAGEHQRTDNSRKAPVQADFRTSANACEFESSDCGSREGRGFEPRRSPYS